ncbi:dihydropteroate synthase [Luteibaculum oceani]|uniref:dihydropteroate synthase n=2 Tax=Luteibaculum oceani TaxID=1294296 RepID=A0A5C6UWP9_9FLAO|nr:dihydropteroate synthase [Luteibaculum oceani]
MGILNINADSFYSGSRVNESELLSRVETMLLEGMDMLDLGAQSSRPGASEMPEETETKILTAAVSALRNRFPELIISVDSYRKLPQKACLDLGSDLINNIGIDGSDELLAPLAVEYFAPYIAMHMRGTPQNMITKSEYKNVLQETIYELSAKVNFLKKQGVIDLIIDPGFGFSKTPSQSLELLKNLVWFKEFELPILAGISRKSMFYKTLEINPEEALNATTFGNTIALQNGASILRVHDIKEAVELKKLHTAMYH